MEREVFIYFEEPGKFNIHAYLPPKCCIAALQVDICAKPLCSAIFSLSKEKHHGKQPTGKCVRPDREYL